MIHPVVLPHYKSEPTATYWSQKSGSRDSSTPMHLNNVDITWCTICKLQMKPRRSV